MEYKTTWVENGTECIVDSWARISHAVYGHYFPYHGEFIRIIDFMR